jgi:ribosomal protein S18
MYSNANATVEPRGDAPREERRPGGRMRESSRCRFCRPDSTEPIDYKNIALMQKMVSPQGKLLSRKRAVVCGFHQRRLETHVKYARRLALLPTVG